MANSAFLAAMVDVENAWLTALVDAGVAPAAARVARRSAIREMRSYATWEAATPVSSAWS